MRQFPPTRYPWVDIHPSDSTLPDFVITNPESFVPVECSHYRCCRKWGINDEEEHDEDVDMPKIFLRRLEMQGMYGYGVQCPEVMITSLQKLFI